MDTICLGSLYVNNSPEASLVGIELEAPVNKPFTIGNTNWGKPIMWVSIGNKLIADRAICFNMTWNTLDYLGFIEGKEISIDGMKFICRIPHVTNIGAFGVNEWSDLLAQEGCADKDLHWKDNYFWAQNPSINGLKSRMLVGYHNPNYRNKEDVQTTDHKFGFRPVLEPEGIFLGEPYNLLDKHIAVFTPDVALCGTLLEVSDYDLTVKLNGPVTLLGQWACHQKSYGVVDINREKVKFVCDLNG